MAATVAERLFRAEDPAPFSPAAVAAALRVAFTLQYTSRSSHIGRCFAATVAGSRAGRALAANARSGESSPAPRVGELFHPYPKVPASVLSIALATSSVPLADEIGPIRSATVSDILDQTYFTGGYISLLRAVSMDGKKGGLDDDTLRVNARVVDRIAFLAETIFCAARGQAVDPSTVTASNLRSAAEIVLAPGSYMNTSGTDAVEERDDKEKLAGFVLAQAVLPRLWRASELVAAYLSGWFRGRHP